MTRFARSLQWPLGKSQGAVGLASSPGLVSWPCLLALTPMGSMPHSKHQTEEMRG